MQTATAARVFNFRGQIYRIKTEMPSPKCNSRERSKSAEANDLLGVFGNRDGTRATGALRYRREVVRWNKTGTFPQGMLYVDNRGSPMDRRTCGIGGRVVSAQGGPKGS